MASGQKTAGSQGTVYAAIELSKKSWVLGIARPDRDRPSIHRVAGGDMGELVGRLRKATVEHQRIVVCYEAGYDGFWLARSLAKLGIECRVLDPASIQVNRRARRVKTDRIDALALLRALIAIDRGERHVCAVVRVPSVEEEDARRSHRERQRLVRERTGHINRIKGLLFAQGIRGIEPKLRRTRIDFATLITAEGDHLPQRLRHELQREYQRLELVEDQIKTVERERDTADAQDPAVDRKRRLLCALQGIGGTSAAILSREVFARSFASRRQLSSYLGLTPSAYDSGSTNRCQGISKAGNSWARRILIEIAWFWRKYQPDSPLSRWYARKTADQSPRIRRIMLVALARKLAISLALCGNRPHPRGRRHGRSRTTADRRLVTRYNPQSFGPQSGPRAGRRVVEATIGVSRAGKKCEPVSSVVCVRACRIVASRHGAAGYKLMRQAHDGTTVDRPRRNATAFKLERAPAKPSLAPCS